MLCFLFLGSCSANNNPCSLPPGSCSKLAPSSTGNPFPKCCVPLGAKLTLPLDFTVSDGPSSHPKVLRGRALCRGCPTVISNPVLQMVNMHMEKVARREIGTLATVQRLPPGQKIIAPESLPPLTPYYRRPLNFCCLDDIGHGVKVERGAPPLSPQPTLFSFFIFWLCHAACGILVP